MTIRTHPTEEDPAPDGDPLRAWCDALAEAYPPGDAEPWDQVGLHVGDVAEDTVHGVLVALDVTEGTLEEAADVGADLLVVHHPLLFTPLRRLTPETAAGRLALRAARQGCAVLAAHTNVDKAAAGTSHPAAAALGLTDLRPLEPLPPPAPDPSAAPRKLVTFVPQADTAAVVAAMAAAGAGVIGDYTGCAFTSPGTGTFVPGQGADPHIGTVGVREEVAEHRVEMVTDAGRLPSVLAALTDAHPYEEVPVDIYPLVPAPGDGTGGGGPPARGLGLVGRLPEPLPLREVARRLAEDLPSPHLRLAAADPDALAETVAVVGGAGDSLIGHLVGPDGPRVDVLVTGDLKHHPALDALTMGLALVDAGHFATEDPAMDHVVGALEARRNRFGLTAPIHRSTLRTDPWTDWKAAT